MAAIKFRETGYGVRQRGAPYPVYSFAGITKAVLPVLIGRTASHLLLESLDRQSPFIGSPANAGMAHVDRAIVRR